jgi:HEAT repeats
MMTDDSKSPTPPSAPSRVHPSIQQAVVDLGIARRTLLIYPFSHNQVKRALRRTFHSLAAALNSEASLTLTVMKEGLAVNERPLEIKTTVFADLAAVFKQYRIAALTISKGLRSKELVRFLRLITTEGDPDKGGGGVAAAFEKHRLDHIRVRIVDYSKLQTTEESQIQRSSRRKSDGSLWQAFVTDLLSEEDPTSAGTKTASDFNSDPKGLAALLNQRQRTSEAAIKHYERAMADAAEVRSKASQGLSAGLPLFQQMIKELNPDLQKQFLATTFDRCTQSQDMGDATHLVDGLGAELIVRMLHQANSDGKQISPSLLAFISKVGYLSRSLKDVRLEGDNKVETSEGLTLQKLESLLAHEQYDAYVDSDYGRLLDGLAVRETAAGQDPAAVVSPLEDNAAGLSQAGINVHAGRAMARMMTTSGDAAGYRDWARQLAYLMNDLLETRAFDYLIELMTLVRSEIADNDPERSEIAELLLRRFSDPQFIAKAIRTIRESGNALPPDALRFLTILGEPVVLEIFDGLDPSQPLPEDGHRVQILKSLSPQATREALERIKDPRTDYVVLLLRMIRKIGDTESAQQVRSLLDHRDPVVRLEALATLLKFNNKWGLVRLREMLARTQAAEFRPALDLTGEYRVREVVPQLISYCRQGGDLELRESALRALGRIGDSRAIPALTRLAHRRWGISQKQIGHLKRVLYDTLDGYPFGEIKHLLHYGLKQKDAVIQSACHKLLRKGTREVAANNP